MDLDELKGKLTRYRWAFIVAGAALLAWLLFRARPVEVEMAVIETGRVEEYVTEEAETQLDVERLVTADRAGTIRRIELEVGDRVQQGQVLTSIEDTELELTVGTLQDQLDEIEGRLAGIDVPLPKQSEIEAAEKACEQAEIEAETLAEDKRAAEAELEFATKESRRIEDLYAQGSASDQQRDRARRELQVAEARLAAVSRRLEAARTAVEIAKLRKQVLHESMQDTAHLRRVYAAQEDRIRKQMDLLVHEAAVRSPVDGVLLEKYVDSEQFVQPGTRLVKIGRMDTIEIRSDILSEEVGRVRPGQKVLLVGKAVGESAGRAAGTAAGNAAGDAAGNPAATGRVKQVYPSGFTKISSLGVRQQRVTVLIDFDNSRLKLGPGYELDVKIAVASADDAVLVPSEAVYATAERSAAFVVEGDRARRRDLRIGLKGEDYYAVIEGLEPGETVILRPPTELEPGARVEPATSEAG